MKQLIAIFGLLLFQTASLFGQGPTEIILMEIGKKNGVIEFSNPVNITERAGYDNQPFFHTKKPMIYYSAAVNGQHDIYAYNYKSKKTSQITDSEDSEYSPHVIPNKNTLACIVQRKSNGDQDLVGFNLKNTAKQKIILESAKTGKIGYQSWQNNSQLIAFVLGSPHELHYFDLITKTDTKYGENLGRSLQVMPNKGMFSYKEKVEDKWLIKSFNSKTREIKTLAESNPAIENYHAWLGDVMIESEDDQILSYDPINKTWNAAVMPASLKNRTITRMSVKGNMISVVIDE